jgi:hypothetical protein
MRATLYVNRYKRQPNQAAMEVAILLVAAGLLNIEGLRLALLYAYGLETADQTL